MSDLRKIPAASLGAEQELSGKDVEETVRVALARLAHERASQRLLALRGKGKFALT